MKNKTLIKILWITSIVFLLLVFGFYICNFKGFKISDNPGDWGQFGDYIGGLLNPFISLLNLIILTYLSLRLVKNDDERNKWTLMELARPYGDITFEKDRGQLYIRISNLGLGPMIVKDIKIIHKDGHIFSNFDHLVEGINRTAKFTFGTFTTTRNHCVIGKGESVNLIDLSGDIANQGYVNILTQFITKLNNYRIEIQYFDMYDRVIDKIEDKVQFSSAVVR